MMKKKTNGLMVVSVLAAMLVLSVFVISANTNNNEKQEQISQTSYSSELFAMHTSDFDDKCGEGK